MYHQNKQPNKNGKRQSPIKYRDIFNIRFVANNKMTKREKKPNKTLTNTPETSIGNRDIRKFLKPFP